MEVNEKNPQNGPWMNDISHSFSPSFILCVSMSSSTTSKNPTALELCFRMSLTLTHDEKVPCGGCKKRHLNYCGSCCRPCLPEGIPAPSVRLPLRVEILRGKEESETKSTASMLAASSPDVRIWELPAFPPLGDPRRVLLLYPSPTSVPVTSLDPGAFDTLLVIDTTWQRAGGVLQLPQLAAPFTHIHLEGEFPAGVAPHTLFWRHQPLGPACLSTAEATYYALRGVEIARRVREGGGVVAAAAAAAAAAAVEASPTPTPPLTSLYDGRFDDLLLFFMTQYHRIQRAYTTSSTGPGGEGGAPAKRFTTKMRKGYIKGEVGEEGREGEGEGEGEGGKDDAEGESAAPHPSALNPKGNEARRKRVKVKGGWTVRMGNLDATAATIKAETQRRFVENTAKSGSGAAGGGGGGGGGGEGSAAAAAAAAGTASQEVDLLFDTVANMRHEYASKGQLLPKVTGGSAKGGE